MLFIILAVSTVSVHPRDGARQKSKSPAQRSMRRTHSASNVQSPPHRKGSPTPSATSTRSAPDVELQKVSYKNGQIVASQAIPRKKNHPNPITGSRRSVQQPLTVQPLQNPAATKSRDAKKKPMKYFPARKEDPKAAEKLVKKPKK